MTRITEGGSYSLTLIISANGIRIWQDMSSLGHPHAHTELSPKNLARTRRPDLLTSYRLLFFSVTLKLRSVVLAPSDGSGPFLDASFEGGERVREFQFALYCLILSQFLGRFRTANVSSSLSAANWLESENRGSRLI